MFELVRDDFEYYAGQKIAVVIDSAGLDPCDMSLSNQNPGQLGDLYAPMGKVATYNGEITAVFNNHIRHNINLFMGCSGAIIFLVNCPGQHHSVKPEDYEKAIAVHVGAMKNSNPRCNVGIRLLRKGKFVSKELGF